MGLKIKNSTGGAISISPDDAITKDIDIKFDVDADNKVSMKIEENGVTGTAQVILTGTFIGGVLDLKI